MNDEELDQIRNIVREEMATQTSTQSSTPTGRIPNLINRTRSMIQAAATSVCNNTLNTTPSPARQTNPHRDRISFGSSKRKKSEIKIIPVVLAVLKYRKEDEYPLTSDCFLLSEVHINLTTAMNESEIRIAIKSAIGSKLPFVSKDDFKFVKGINKRVIVPTTSADYSFAYPQVKKLMGSGKLYIQLKFQLSPPESGDEYTDDDSVELPQALFPRASTSFGPSTSTSSLSGTSPSRPSTSSSSGPSTSSASGPSTSSASGPSTSSPSGPSTSSPFGPSTSSPSGPSTSSLYGPSSSSSEDQVISTVKTIQEIFPWLSENCIQFMSTQRSDVNELLNHLLTLSPQKLLSCQIECNPKQRIVVDKEFIVEECISSYKDPNFDINFPLRIVFRGEPGVDAGGLLREFYSLFFEKICTDRAFDLFEGDGSALMPKSNFNICMTEIFVTLGKIVAHNICQNGIGFPYLAPAIFEYIAHASVPHAALFLTLADANLGYQHYIAQISNANEDELADLRNDNDFMSIMQEIGETCMLNLTTRHQVIQSMLVHDVLVKRKASLDQFRKGLSTLNVLKIIEENPKQMRHLFVEGPLNAEKVISHIVFKNHDQEQCDTMRDVIRSFNSDQLAQFCSFVTGSPVPSVGERLHVEFTQSPAITSSTCAQGIVVPPIVSREFNLLKPALLAVMDTASFSRNFNTM